MSTNYDQIQAGWSAHGRDGEKIGEIEEIGQNYVLVTKGLIFPKDLYIPMSVIQSVDSSEGQVILDVEKSQVDDMGWDQPPEASGASSWGEGSSYDTQTTTTDTGTADYGTTGAASVSNEASYATTDASYGTTQQTSATDYTEGDTLRVPVHEEQLRAERTSDVAGEVRVDRNVVEEQRSIDVPVTREEVEVRRVPVSGSASADASAFTDGDTIRVPVTEEQIHVTKEPRVVEEIEISKRQVTENQRVSDTVRREEVSVDESGVRSGTGTGMGTTGSYAGDASYSTGTTGTTDVGYDTDTSGDDRSRGSRGEVGGEAIGGGAGALGGAVVGGVVGGPIGAAVGGVIGGAGGAVAGESAEGGDEQAGSGAGGAAGALGGAVVGGAIAGPPGAVVGGAVGAGAGSGAGDKATEDDDDLSRR